METVAAPVIVEPVIDQAHGEHDLDLVFPDGRAGAAEVASVVDPRRLRLYDAILNDKHGGEVLRASVSQGDWYVYPEMTATIARIRADVDAYLAALEAQGVTDFFFPSTRTPERFGMNEGAITSQTIPSPVMRRCVS